MHSRVAVALSLLGWACADDDGQRHELPGLTVIEDFDDPICAGTFPYFERRLAWLELETGLLRDPRGLAYHWYLEKAEVEQACDFPLGGCTKGRTFYGNVMVFSHELVHAHLSRLGRPRPWLSEGMATMLADERSGPPQPLFTPSVMMQLDDVDRLDYPAAGAFTTYLRDRYRMARLLDYYEASADTDAAASLASFADIFGDEFADVEADYLKRGLPAGSGSLDCDGNEVVWSDGSWDHAFDLTCEGTGSIGPESSDSDVVQGTFLWSRATMTAPAGWVSLDLETSGPAWISVLSCAGGESAYVAADQPHADVNLAGGRYLVLADAFVADAPTARVTVRRLDAAPAAVRRDLPWGLHSQHIGRRRRDMSRPPDSSH